ncbi:MAG: hypothetical protein L3J39_08215 [Verrucomicrobiales bacterium]|nr:hypothetical protein [Verrucomicrobiales bacterium]
MSVPWLSAPSGFALANPLTHSPPRGSFALRAACWQSISTPASRLGSLEGFRQRHNKASERVLVGVGRRGLAG